MDKLDKLHILHQREESLAMALPMARDLAREGIRVNTILPGFYETPIYGQMNDNVKDALRAHLQFPNRFRRCIGILTSSRVHV